MAPKTTDPSRRRTSGKIVHLPVSNARPAPAGERADAPRRTSPTGRSRRATGEPSAPPGEGRFFEALAEMAARVVANGSVSEAQRGQLAIIQALLEPKACFVTELVPSRSTLQVSAVRGRNDERIRAYALTDPPVGRAFSEARTVREDGMIAVPVVGRGWKLGCLVLVGPKEDVPDRLCQALAAQVAAGWEFARLRDESARRNKDLETAVAGLKSLERSREELLSSVSHDLKNPLTTVKAYLTMLLRGKLGEIAERQLRALQTCDRNADRLLRMIDDVLLISRLQSGKMALNERPFGLKAVTDEVVRALAASADQVKVRLGPPRGPEVFVRGDRERIAEALHHLVDSAIQLCERHATVELSVSQDEAGLAVLSVRDGGLGFSEEDRSHLFDPYYRPQSSEERRRLSGLSLPIVAKIVHLHGGRIETTSRLGEGTLFQLYLPMFAGAVAPAPSPRAQRPGGILLVEDDADCREVLQQVLEEEGYRVMSAASASEARSVLENIRPGLVLLDLRLRDDDGRTVLHFLRQQPQLAEIPVYIISGASDVGSLGSGQGKDRIDGFFEKPLKVGKLLDTVASVVRPSRGPPARVD